MPITWSPTAHSVTRRPSAATTPAYSRPGISGAGPVAAAAGIGVAAAPLQHVGPVDRGVVDVDEDLVGSRDRRVDVGDLQDLGPAVLAEHHRARSDRRRAGSAVVGGTKTRSR